MRARLLVWGLLCLLCAAGVWFLWHRENGGGGSPSRPQTSVATAGRPNLGPKISSGVISTNVMQISATEWNANKLAGRLSNTTQPIGQLVNDRHAILLANALIDTAEPLNFAFPKNLQPQGDPGAYIVQARGPIDQPFRMMLAQAGATIVSYIPNDAYLVRASASAADMLDANALVQAVVPYEPYYKIQSALLYPAANQIRLADGEALNLGLFADNAPATVQQIEKLGGQVIGEPDQSPFGPVVRVIPPKDWTTLVTLSGVGWVEPFHSRTMANDLSRAANGVAADSLTATNYLGLTGSNIIVEVNDTGIDAQHPDLTAGGNYGKVLGVIGDAPQSLVDTDGHGTHVAGIIAGDGTESTTVTNVPGSILPGGTGTNFQFRGMAPGVTLYSVAGITGGAEANIVSDQYLQQAPALTNALISNNSWVFEGDSAYDLEAASYDAAVRDALPFVTGSQPVLFVFAAGNAGNGSDSQDLGGGIADSIESPATAKDVISVGAIQEDRNITATVTNADGTSGQPWLAETSTGYRVAGFSSRGNVGIGIEGSFGRYKPDVVAPGTFTVSTRSEQWDIGTYFYQNPTNDQSKFFSGYIVQPGSIVSRPFPTIPTNTVELLITTFPNANSPFSFAFLPTLIGLFGTPGYQYLSTNDPVTIPPGPPTLAQILSSQNIFGFNYAISNNTSSQVIFDLETDIITTNGSGNYFLVLSNLNNAIGKPNSASTGPGAYYRYESGTSMAAADVSGVLALMQQFYANAYHVTPSPAMLKAMLVNGAQATGLYNFQVQNTLNYEGWGSVNLPDSLPPGITNQTGQPCSAFVQDQNSTNALATGASQTYQVTLNSNAVPLRVTLAWTDPPGDPAAAIKLVNNLVLVVTNLSNPTNPIVYYGNDIPASSTVNSPHATNTPPVFDSINNVQNVYLPPGAGTSFSVAVLGYRVNVNAVTAQTNNVVQDYALVISTGNSGLTNVMTVNPVPASSGYNATGDQQVTYLSPTAVGFQTSYQLLLNQFAGANTPLLGNSTLVFPPGTNGFGPNNWQVTTGMTNQWQFYVVTNANNYSNAAFVTFNPNAPNPDTLSVPRMGVFSDSVGNATRDADIDLYVSTDPTITNLNPVAISNCVVGTQIGAPPGGPFNGASLGRGTTEFVVDTNSQSRSPDVYYVGVKSEDQMSAEYGFITIFSAAPFSTMNQGTQTVYGVPVPMNIPDGTPTIPGKGYVFGLAIYPETAGTVTVSNEITHQNFGDLIGTLTLNGGHADVLNNHDSLGGPPGPYFLTYDDSAGGGIFRSRPSDGPGSLIGYMGQPALGVWMLTEVDDSLTQTGAVNSFTTTIQPSPDLTQGANFFVPPNTFLQVGFVDVPPGATNLTIYGTNLTDNANPPLELFVKFGAEPTTNDFDETVFLNGPGIPGPGGSISIGPPLESGRYFVGVYNPSSTTREVYLLATIGLGTAPVAIFNSSDTPIPILDDAVTTDSIYVPANQTISSMDVAIAVQHPRISDLVFHLISPDGTRDLLMENRGGTDPNGAGGVATVTTNVTLVGNFDTTAATNYIPGQSVAGWSVTGSQVTVQTDPTNAPVGSGLSNYLALANGTLYANLPTTPGATYTLTFQYRGPGIVSWWRGESNTIDSINGNNGTPTSITYTNGEVSNAFVFNGTSSAITAPASPNLNVGLGGGFTLETWVNPTTFPGDQMCMLEWNNNNDSIAIGTHFWLATAGSANLYANLVDTGGTNHNIYSVNVMTTGTFQDVALTYNKVTGIAVIYRNGVAVTNQYLGNFTPQTSYPFYMGYRIAGASAPAYLNGDLDEVSVYNRALSPSEIQAIYNDGINGNPQGGNGKYDPAALTPTSSPSNALSLAEVQVNINNGGAGIVTNFFGNNTNWQTYTVSFTASSANTTLQIQGVEPGMLLDAMSVTNITTNYSYLVFTENTNLTTTPIKFAVPPFVPGTNSIIWQNGFEQGSVGTQTTPLAGSYFAGGWYVNLGSVDVLSSGFGGGSNPYQGSYYLDLDGNNPGTISTNVATVPGQTYTLSFAYSKNPSALSTPSAAVFVGGNQLGTVTANIANSWSSLNWQTTSYVFTATSPLTQLAFQSPDPFNDASGVLLDDITLGLSSSNLYYLPEQPLDVYDGLNAQGPWTLEIQDDRAGATNPLPLLLSWQLRFNFVTEGTNGIGIPPGITATNVIPANDWAYYQINVPTNADIATNTLVFATGPLNVWFNSSNNPAGINPPDWLLFGPATSGSSTLNTFNTPTNIVPGGVYYIGLQNTNSFQVTNGFAVNFHYFQITPLNPGQPVTNTVAGAISGDGVDYYSIAVPTNADYATNILVSSTVPVNVWFNQTKAPVCLTPPDSLLISNAMSGVSILSSNSAPPLLPGLTYYLAVQNTNAANATYALEVNFSTISILTNGVPATNSVPTNSFAYYEVQVPTNADYATNLLLFASQPVNVWFNQSGLPTGVNPPDSLLIGNAMSGAFTLSAGSTPPLAPGATYYLGVQNTNNVPVNFGLEVNFHFVYGSGITSGPTITYTNIGGTNGILLTWFAQTNYHYQIQWVTALAPAPIPWTTIPGVVLTNLPAFTPTNGIGEFQYFDNGLLTGGFGTTKFYRLIAYPPGTTIPPSLVIISVKAAPGGLQFQWDGSTNYIYDIAWTTNLTRPPASWNVISNLTSPTLIYSGGVFTFTDNGTLTGGSSAAKFFRVLLLP